MIGKIYKKIDILLVSAALLSFLFLCSLPMPVRAERMGSANYLIPLDSLNFAGIFSNSASYGIQDTAGEVATGLSQATSNNLNAGYQQADTVPVAPTPTPTPTPTSPPTGGGSSGGSGPFSPTNVTNFTATPFQNNIRLDWQYPPNSGIVSVRIVRSENFYPSGINDGEVVFEGNGESAFDNDVVAGVRYYYTLFARSYTGQYSSGALATGRIPLPGESAVNPPTDVFENIPQAENIDAIIAALELSDFDFIQDGRKIAMTDGQIAVDGGKNLTLTLDYGKVPEILKTIAITLSDPDDPTKIFTFLLRVNEDKTAYEATIAPLLKSGNYKISIIIVNFENQSLKRIDGSIRVFNLPPGVGLFEFKNNPFLLFCMIGLLILAFIAVIYLIYLERKKKKKAAKAASIIILLLAIIIPALLPQSAEAVINKQINYQGKLADTAGLVVPDGSYNIRFNLYTAATGGASIWNETWCYSPDSGATCNGTGSDSRAVLRTGLFSLLLGSTTSLVGVDFNQTLYLGVEIGGTNTAAPVWDGEMSPRKKIGAVPAAFVADTLDNLSSEQFLRSDAVNSTSTATTFLTITQNGSGKIAEFFGPGASSVLSLLSNGNVGIGTSSPSQTLSVQGNALISGNLTVGGFTATGTPIFTSLGTNMIVTTNALGALVSSSTPTAAAYFATSTTATSTFAGGITGPGNFTVQSSSGNVGIGTTSPQGLLDISGSSASTDSTVFDGTRALSLINRNTTNNNMSGFDFRTMDANGLITTGSKIMGIYTSHAANAVSSELSFLTRNAGTISEKMRLTSAGNFGIGTSSPYAKLSVHANNGETNTTLFAIASSTAIATSTLFTVLNNGNVGIGTAAPTHALTFPVSSTGIAIYNTADQTTNFERGLLVFTGNRFEIGTQLGGSGTGRIVNFVSSLGQFNFGRTFGSTGLLEVNVAPNLTGVINLAAFKTGNLAPTTGLAHGIALESAVAPTTGTATIDATTISPIINTTGTYVGTVTALKISPFLQSVTGATVNLLDVGSNSAQSTAGTHTSRMIVTSAGNVGIGTSSPYAKLSIHALNGETNPSLFAIASSTAIATSTLFTVLSSGNVGIGTNPAVTLHVKNTNTQVAKLEMTSPPAAVATMFDGVFTTDPGFGTNLFRFQAPVDGGVAGLAFGQAVNYTALGTTDIFQLWNRNTKKFTVTSTGKVLIDPSTSGSGNDSSLQITQTFTGNATNIQSSVRINDSSTISAASGGYASIYIPTVVNQTTDTNSIRGIFINPTLTAVSGSYRALEIANNAHFGIYQSGANATNYFAGKVGIGTTSPLAKLDVAGAPAGTVPIFQVSSVTAGFATTTRLIVDSGGNVGISTTSPWRTLSVVGTVAFNGLATSVTGNALCITTAKDITDAGAANCVPSAERFKENIITLAPGTALGKLNKLRVVSFDYKNGSYSSEESPSSYGFIAEEVGKIDPLLVDYGYDGLPMTLHFERITGLTVQAVQEIAKTVEGFEAKLASSTANVHLTTEDEIGLFQKFVKMLENFGVKIAEGIATFKKVVVESLHIGTKEKPAGLVLYDEEGTPYCLRLLKGGLASTTPVTAEGECPAISTSTPALPIAMPDNTASIMNTIVPDSIAPAPATEPQVPAPDLAASSTPVQEASSTPSNPGIEPAPAPDNPLLPPLPPEEVPVGESPAPEIAPAPAPAPVPEPEPASPPAPESP